MIKNKLLFLCSGGGGNLRFVLTAIKLGYLVKWGQVIVLADRNCIAVDYARSQGLKVEILDFTEGGQNSVADFVEGINPDVVITTVNRILSTNVLQASGSNFINLHYSLLPSFSGTIGFSTLRSALDYGVKFVGVTVHDVTPDVDLGQPLSQGVTSVCQFDSPISLMNRLFQLGCLCIYSSLKSIETDEGSQCNESVTIRMPDGVSAMINPSVIIPDHFSTGEFWRRVGS